MGYGLRVAGCGLQAAGCRQRVWPYGVLVPHCKLKFAKIGLQIAAPAKVE